MATKFAVDSEGTFFHSVDGSNWEKAQIALDEQGKAWANVGGSYEEYTGPRVGKLAETLSTTGSAAGSRNELRGQVAHPQATGAPFTGGRKLAESAIKALPGTEPATMEIGGYESPVQYGVKGAEQTEGPAAGYLKPGKSEWDEYKEPTISQKVKAALIVPAGVVSGVIQQPAMTIAKAAIMSNALGDAYTSAIMRHSNLDEAAIKRHEDGMKKANDYITTIANDVISGNMNAKEAVDTALSKGFDPDSNYIGALKFLGETGGTLARFGLEGPVAGVDMVMSSFIDRSHQVLQEGGTIGQSLAAGAVSSAVAGTMLGLKPIATKTVTGVVADKVLRATGFSLLSAAADTGVDTMILGKDVTPEEFTERLKEVGKSMGAFELLGLVKGVKGVKAYKQGKEIASSYSSPEHAINDLVKPVEQAKGAYFDSILTEGKDSPTTKELKKVYEAEISTASKALAAVGYAKKSGLKFTGPEPTPEAKPAEAAPAEVPRFLPPATYREATPAEREQLIVPGKQAKFLEPQKYREATQAEREQLFTPNADNAISKQPAFRQATPEEAGAVIKQGVGGLERKDLRSQLRTEAERNPALNTKLNAVLEGYKQERLENRSPAEKEAARILAEKGTSTEAIRSMNDAELNELGARLGVERGGSTRVGMAEKVITEAGKPAAPEATRPAEPAVVEATRKLAGQRRPGEAGSVDLRDIQLAMDKFGGLVKGKLGLPAEASHVEIANEVMRRIGALGASVKDTAIRIMGKVKGIGREAASVMADLLHKANPVQGRAGEQGAVRLGIERKEKVHAKGDLMTREPKYVDKIARERGVDTTGLQSKREKVDAIIKAQKEKLNTPEKQQIAAERAAGKELTREAFPTDSPEDVAARNLVYKHDLQRGAKDAAEVKQRHAEATTSERIKAETPMAKVKQSISDAVLSARMTFTPSSSTKAVRRVSGHLVSQEAVAREAMSYLHDAVTEEINKIASFSQEQRDLYADAIEHPELRKNFDKNSQDLMDTINKFSKVTYDAMKGEGADFGFVEHYLPQLCKDPVKFEAVMNNSRKKLGGSMGFMEMRSAKDMKEFRTWCKENGLELASNNPLELFTMGMQQQWKAIATVRGLKGAIEEGLISTTYKKDWVPLDTKVAGSLAKAGATPDTYFAPEPVAHLFNNILAPGLKFKGYNTLREINGYMNRTQLGLSAFHAWVVSNEISATMAGLAFKDIMSGNITDSTKGMLKAIGLGFGHASIVKDGGGIIEEIQAHAAGARELTGEALERFNYYKLAGFSPRMDPSIVTNDITKLKCEMQILLDPNSTGFVRTKALGKIPIQALMAGVEQCAKPIMEHYVPKAKAGLLNEMYQRDIKKLREGNATQAEIQETARRNWRLVEDTLGQFTYDNLFMKSSTKQILQLSLRAFGWKFGSVEATYGAAKDFAMAASYELPVTIMGKMGIMPETYARMKEYQRSTGRFGTNAWFTNRMGWAMGTAFTTAAFSTMVNTANAIIRQDADYLPKEMIDFVFPKLYKKKNGEFARLFMPSYIKEWADHYLAAKKLAKEGSTEGYGEIATSAMGPEMQTAKQLWTGKDFQGTDTSRTSTVASTFLPMGVAKFVDTIEMGAPVTVAVKRALKQALGLMEAKKKLTRSGAENKVYEYLRSNRTEMSKEEFDGLNAARGISDLLNEDDITEEQAEAMREELVPKAFMSASELRDPEAALEKAASKLPFDKLHEIFYKYASDDEKVLYGKLALQKANVHLDKTQPANMDRENARIDKLQEDLDAAETAKDKRDAEKTDAAKGAM